MFTASFPASPTRARRACKACRQLKRRCSRDMPSCSLCLRLRKTCRYDEHEQETPVDSSSGTHTEKLSKYFARSCGMISYPRGRFPGSYFQDTELFNPLNTDALALGYQDSVEEIASAFLGPDRAAVCENFLSTVHKWLPIVSKKHLLDAFQRSSSVTESSQTILLLAMKLCTMEGQDEDERDLYNLTKSLCSAAESAGSLTLRLIQALVLLAVYEMSQAINPAAYLTIGRAARLCTLMGFQSNNMLKLFKPANTWTMREEQRRTWWAVFVLDRIFSVDTDERLSAALAPSTDELLPLNDADWDLGKVVASQSLYTISFSSATTINGFACVCQASHMQSKVAEHKVNKISCEERQVVLEEAITLDRAVSALQHTIEGPWADGRPSHTLTQPDIIALAICASARLQLYELYKCNESFPPLAHKHFGLETDLQITALNGEREIIKNTARWIATTDPGCSLIAPCLYHAATACAWYVREDHEPEEMKVLEAIVSWFQALAGRWEIGEQYLALLDQGGIMELLTSDVTMSAST